MSGIAGLWNLDGRQLENLLLARIGSTIAHRGRDFTNIWCHDSVGFIAHVSRISPESARERQPLNDGYGNALLFDGRLDNREDLLSQIGDSSVTAHSPDSELIFEAFLRWGIECVSRLNGDFALAIFDSRSQQLILARDPVGCRPLYYATSGRTFVFGSEIKAVLAHPDVRTRPNEDLIADYFVRDRLPYEDCGETFFQDVYAVLPGQRISVTTAGLASTTFWDFDPESILHFASYWDYAERLRELLFQAVKRRLRTVHPAAVAVSGGLDSSIVLCVAEQLRRSGETAAVLLPISLTPAAGETPESAHALARLESTTQLRIERLPFGAPGPQLELETAARNSEWPRFDDGWCALRPMFTWTQRQGSRTLLSGHWSDQLSFVTGYLSDLFASLKWREIGDHLDEYSRWFVDADPRYFRTRFRRELAFNLTSHRVRRWVRPFVRRRPVAHGDRFVAANVAARLERPRPESPRPRCHSAHARDIYLTVRTQAHRLQFEADAKLAASCQVDWTTPFLDRDLIAYLMAVPGEIQNRGGVPRALLRDAMRAIVPDVILRRRWGNDDDVVRTRELEYLSTAWTFDAAHALGFVREPWRVERDTLEFAGLESWSRVFFSDRLTSLQHPPDGVCEAMDTADPAPKDDREKLPYAPPKLTVHGDLRTITAAKQSDRSEAGQPKTFNSGMP
jgi:asparagine synthase (glutamine-hydrolysing)